MPTPARSASRRPPQKSAPLVRPAKRQQDATTVHWRQRVVGAVRLLFNETGYHGTSVEDLSRATGLSKGSLYGAFGDKHGLFLRALDEYIIEGVKTTIPLYREVFRHYHFVKGNLDTGFLQEYFQLS